MGCLAVIPSNTPMQLVLEEWREINLAIKELFENICKGFWRIQDFAPEILEVVRTLHNIQYFIPLIIMMPYLRTLMQTEILTHQPKGHAWIIQHKIPLKHAKSQSNCHNSKIKTQNRFLLAIEGFGFIT